MRVVFLAGLVLGMAGTAMAEPVKAREARAAVFPATPSEAEMRPHRKLPADQAAILAQVAETQAHYGAIAFSPDDGLMSDATVAAIDYHSTEAAATAAVAGCDAKRKGRATCEVVALIRPKGWSPRAVQMSVSASEALRKSYGGSGKRAMAIAGSTGAFGLGKGAAAEVQALADCAKGGATDCRIVVAD